MAVIETYAQREARLSRGNASPVYRHDALPPALRYQVIYIMVDAIGTYRPYDRLDPMWSKPASNGHWEFICWQMAREFGKPSLGTPYADALTQCQEFLLSADVPSALSLIEVSFRYIDRIIREQNPYHPDVRSSHIKQEPDSAIEELNARFKQHGLGYQYIDGRIIRVDSDYIYQETVDPAIRLLHDAEFAGPESEYLNAHTHYREGRYAEAIVSANNAFESTMKAVCLKLGWTYQENDTAKPLLDVLFANGLIPAELHSHFTALRSVLESGAPSARNKPGRGHGGGIDPVKVPDYMARFVLNTVATDIVLLVERYRALRP